MTSKLLNKDDAIAVITRMTRAYMEQHGRAPRTLIAVGGTAMAMHGLRPLSEDIDLYAAEDAFAPIAESIERQSGIRIDVTSKTTLWGTLNIRDIEADAQVTESVEIDGFRVDIAAISPETLFVIKASTLRTKDRDDLPLIWPSVTIDKLMSRAESLLEKHDEHTANDVLMNLLSEIQVVALEPVSAEWFTEAPGLAERFRDQIERDFGVNVIGPHGHYPRRS